MSAVVQKSLVYDQAAPMTTEVMVVGAGPVGIYFINELIKRSPSTEIKVFGGEASQPYNRVRLTDVLSGNASHSSLFTSEELPELENIDFSWNNPITEINHKNNYVIDQKGDKHYYKNLVLALGSKPRVPDIPGKGLKNVYTFRDLDELEALMGRQVSSRNTVVIGGGLLGIEAAKAMQRFNTKVFCIEHSTRLMFSQLDDKASKILEKHLEQQNIKTRINRHVTEIIADEHTITKVSAVRLSDDEVIPCDTVIFSTGIIPNIQLVRGTGISVGRGINVDDYLKTSVNNIYAVGECAEHEEQIYGLASPGFEQASVLAENLSGGEAYYLGSTTTSQLKVLKFPVFSMGETGINASVSDQYIYSDPDNKIYRKIVVINNRLKGVVAVGDWPSRYRIQEAVENNRYLWFWKPLNFVSSGELWDAEENNVCNWPPSTTVCNCMKVSRGELSAAIDNGCQSFEELIKATGASTVCGSCRPLVQQLASNNELVSAEKGSAVLWVFSVISALFLLAFYFLPAMPYAESVQSTLTNIDSFWRNTLYKQISGFTLLGLTLLILLLSLRKRMQFFQFGAFPYWRVFHVVVGTLLFTVLFLHTGFRFGNELNFLLMMTFSTLMLLGVFASVSVAKEPQLSQRYSARFFSKFRRMSIWTHILLFWPVPALLGFHILKGYYF